MWNFKWDAAGLEDFLSFRSVFKYWKSSSKQIQINGGKIKLVNRHVKSTLKIWHFSFNRKFFYCQNTHYRYHLSHKHRFYGNNNSHSSLAWHGHLWSRNNLLTVMQTIIQPLHCIIGSQLARICTVWIHYYTSSYLYSIPASTFIHIIQIAKSHAIRSEHIFVITDSLCTSLYYYSGSENITCNIYCHLLEKKKFQLLAHNYTKTTITCVFVNAFVLAHLLV